MIVKELKALLDTLPDDMEIIETRCSDYGIMELDSWAVIRAVPKDFYVMRSHPTMSEENKSKEQDFLHYQGN